LGLTTVCFANRLARQQVIPPQVKSLQLESSSRKPSPTSSSNKAGPPVKWTLAF